MEVKQMATITKQEQHKAHETANQVTNQTREQNKGTSKAGVVITPETDIYSDEKAVYMEVAMPGVSKEGVEISIEKDTLTIKGENSYTPPEDLELKYAEYRPGNYRRSFQLNDTIDTDNIEAVMKNGILRLKLAIRQPVVKKVTVKAE